MSLVIIKLLDLAFHTERWHLEQRSVVAVNPAHFHGAVHSLTGSVCCARKATLSNARRN